MKSLKNIKSIVNYTNIPTKYSVTLENILDKIRIKIEINSSLLNSEIKYRRIWDNSITNLESKHYLDRGRWTDFILFAEKYIENNKTKINPISIQELYSTKLNVSLLLFWRDIANKLSSDTVFKLQLKLNLIFTSENSADDQNLTNMKDFPKMDQIRSIGSVKVYSNKNLYEALTYFKLSLDLIIDNYSSFYIKNIILTYNICYDDSILKKINITDEIYNLINESQTSKKEKINKSQLKINDKNLPVTTDLIDWGDLNIIKGDYPYKFNLKESKVLIKTDSINNNTQLSESFNYIVSIRGLYLSGKQVIIQRVSVTDKNLKLVILNFIDIILNPQDPKSFIRIIKDTQYVYEKSIKVLTQKRKKSKYFTNLKTCKTFKDKFITMDLETKDNNGILTPYCVSIFDGKISYSFYITDYKSPESMLKASLQFILKRKYNEYKVYLHNFSYFDGIFLMRIITDIVKSNSIKPVIRDNRIINLRVEFLPENYKNKQRKYYVEFRDSYLLLTTSLEKLGKTFALNEGKLVEKLPFPYRFVNEPNIKYNYIGTVPEYKFYDKITESDYNKLILTMKSEGKDLTKWDLKKETIKYCEQDCKTLYYSILEFGKLIYLQFNVDISKTPTVSSLAFRIFRVKFLEQNKNISILNGSIYKFIYQSYYGGHVDAYIPYGKNIKAYDVNSLYPNSMFRNTVPVGNPYYFEGNLDYFNKINFNYPTDMELNGDYKNKIPSKTIYSYLNEIFNIEKTSDFITRIKIFLNLDNKNGVLCNKNNLPYGFFEVLLETPPKNEWNQPILLKKHKTKFGGSRTIAPVGKWTGVYFSDELYNAKNNNHKHNYKTKRGFLFRQDYLFKDYVETLYNLRISSPKNSPINIIAKLLLNSLYGRFGMNPEKANHIILSDNQEKDNLMLKNEIINIIDFGNDKELISYIPKIDNENSDNLNDDADYDSSMLINVGVASAVTGLSRIHMSYFKNNPLFKLYYSDTDSAFVDVNLAQINPEIIGNELGQLKLEYDLLEAVFLGPKIYGGITSDGKSIVKAKGVKNIIPFDDLKSLMQKGVKLQIPSEKWYRSLSEGNIKIKQEIYNLAIHSSKRELIYDKNGVLVNTQPLEINE